MKITQLDTTCSMVELGKVSYDDVESVSFDHILALILQSKRDFHYNAYPSIIVYNTTFDWRTRLKIWWRWGFKTKHSYIGSTGDRVYVMFRKL